MAGAPSVPSSVLASSRPRDRLLGRKEDGRTVSRLVLEDCPSARNPIVTRYARFAAARRPISSHHPALEVGDAGRLDGPDLLELHLRVPEVLEEASTVAEQHRNDVELKFVQLVPPSISTGSRG